jgi:hypothetical protein
MTGLQLPRHDDLLENHGTVDDQGQPGSSMATTTTTTTTPTIQECSGATSIIPYLNSPTNDDNDDIDSNDGGSTTTAMMLSRLGGYSPARKRPSKKSPSSTTSPPPLHPNPPPSTNTIVATAAVTTTTTTVYLLDISCRSNGGGKKPLAQHLRNAELVIRTGIIYALFPSTSSYARCLLVSFCCPVPDVCLFVDLFVVACPDFIVTYHPMLAQPVFDNNKQRSRVSHPPAATAANSNKNQAQGVRIRSGASMWPSMTGLKSTVAMSMSSTTW